MDKMQIEDDCKMKKSVHYFLDRLDQRIADPEIPEALILQESQEYFMLLQGKKVEKSKGYFYDEEGKTYAPAMKDLMVQREKDLKLKYCDNFFTRYIYYSTTNWFKRLGAAMGFQSGS